MKAILFDRLGGPEVMYPGEVPKPALRPGGVLVHNRVIAVNFADTFFTRGEYIVRPVFPDIPGMESAGVIDAVAPDVTDLKPGMRVACIGMGTYAEYTLIGRSRVIPLPDFMSFEQGAALPIAMLTAWHMLNTLHTVRPGDNVLVHSAAGAVGIAAVQIAKAAGARVIGTVSSAEKAAIARQYGADEVIDYETQDFAAEAKRLTGGRGVDLILDAVGKPTFARGLTCLAPFGHLILFGRAGGAPGPIDPMKLFERSLRVSGFVLPHIYSNRELMRRGLDDAFRLIREGRLTVPIGGTYPLAEAAAAHRHVMSRSSIGKLILMP
ncbi:MAG TPA: quinone oxidoreductase [Candidatus Binataceae bacterium]|nr:quinone oxidoreductase [Candidatus Binataceae bacterium]